VGGAYRFVLTEAATIKFACGQNSGLEHSSKFIDLLRDPMCPTVKKWKVDTYKRQQVSESTQRVCGVMTVQQLEHNISVPTQFSSMHLEDSSNCSCDS
jgi:hypothetical protein